jgi:hypothetical protein
MLLRPLQAHVVCSCELGCSTTSPVGHSCPAFGERGCHLFRREGAPPTDTCGLLGNSVQATCVVGQASGAHSAARGPRTRMSLLSAHSATGVVLVSVAAALVGSWPDFGDGVLCCFAAIGTLFACYPEVYADGGAKQSWPARTWFIYPTASKQPAQPARRCKWYSLTCCCCLFFDQALDCAMSRACCAGLRQGCWCRKCRTESCSQVCATGVSALQAMPQPVVGPTIT